MEKSVHAQYERGSQRDQGQVLVYGKSNNDTCSADKRGSEIGKSCKDSENSR